jgi:hypothetical protein
MYFDVHPWIRSVIPGRGVSFWGHLCDFMARSCKFRINSAVFVIRIYKFRVKSVIFNSYTFFQNQDLPFLTYIRIFQTQKSHIPFILSSYLLKLTTHALNSIVYNQISDPNNQILTSTDQLLSRRI